MSRETTSTSPDSLETYLAELNRYPLLTVDEEQQLARAFRDCGDTRAAHRLVTANLRFVVKVAYEYRSYGLKMADLIQEGNIGLMKAVQKFDPDKKIRLISYGVWWIRAYIQNHILKSWSLVKLGTTQAQRKLFFSLARTKRELDRLSPGEAASAESIEEQIATKLRVKRSEVQEMSQRMNGRDFSLDAPMGEDGTETHLDHLAGTGGAHDEELSAAEQDRIVTSRVAQALARLDERERYIIEKRVMSESPETLKDLGEHFGFSRERARQLEIRAKAKLKAELEGLAGEIEWPTDGVPVDVDERARA